MKEVQGGLVFLVFSGLKLRACIMDGVKYILCRGLKSETSQPVQNRVNKPVWLEQRSLGKRSGKEG